MSGRPSDLRFGQSPDACPVQPEFERQNQLTFLGQRDGLIGADLPVNCAGQMEQAEQPFGLRDSVALETSPQTLGLAHVKKPIVLIPSAYDSYQFQTPTSRMQPKYDGVKAGI